MLPTFRSNVGPSSSGFKQFFYLSVTTHETAERHTTEDLNSQLNLCEGVTTHSCLLLISFVNELFPSFVFECNILLTPPIISFNLNTLQNFAENT